MGEGSPGRMGTELVPPHFAGPPALFPEAWAQVSCLAENARMLQLGGLGSVTPQRMQATEAGSVPEPQIRDAHCRILLQESFPLFHLVPGCG